MTEQDQQDKQMEPEHLQDESNKIPLDRALMSAYLTERMLRYGKILVNREKIKGKSIEEITASVEEYTRAKDAREHLAEMDAIPEEKAFHLATLAYDIEDDKEALNLAREALAIDPNCLDAKIVEAMIVSSDIQEEIARLRRAIRKEKDRLGKEYFEENTGRFWSNVETRPYMRAKKRIADLLFDTFEIEKVESEWLDMLEIDKEDHHGIVYKLLNLYLLTEQLEKARMTMKTYEGDLDPVFTYGKVLERYLSNDIAGAERALKKAYDHNPYVYTMLIGKMDPKADYSEAFRDDELFDEAYSFLEDEGTAWLDHEDARYWLEDQNLPIKRPKGTKKPH